MADRPILFSAPMVRALLDGRKTQTRRIINFPGVENVVEFVQVGTDSRTGTPVFEMKDAAGQHLNRPAGKHCVTPHYSPRFAKGDRLWVKETWRDEHPIAIQEGRYSQPGRAGIPGPPGVSYRTIYRADGEPLQAWRRADGEHPYFTLDGPADDAAARHPTVCSTFNRADGRGAFWDSARYMPRWASRLTLTVTDVRVQRLQEISKADAQAEGTGVEFMDHRLAFEAIWRTINGAGAWESNPWVVALTFTVERRNIDTGASA